MSDILPTIGDKTTLSLSFDSNGLTSYTSEYIAALWHAAQHSDASSSDMEACRVVERIGREIIRRWLTSTEPTLWSRQGSHAYSLPKIERDAKITKVIDASKKVVSLDHGSNLASYRQEAVESIEILAEALHALTK